MSSKHVLQRSLLSSSLIVLLLLSLTPSLPMNGFLPPIPAQTLGGEGPSSLSYVLIGYAGCLDGPYALLFYSYQLNNFCIRWYLNDTTCVSDCIKAEGTASYYVWLRIKDKNNNTIVDEKWAGFQWYEGDQIINCTTEAGNIVWPLSWEFFGIAAGINKSDFWNKVDEFLDKTGTILTIVAMASIIAGAVASVYLTGGASSSIAAVIAKEAAIVALKISWELFKDHLTSQLQDEVIAWLDGATPSEWDPGGAESWSIILMGAYSPEIEFGCEATLDLTGPSYLEDTLDTTESGDGPYEVKQYRMECTATRFNWISLDFYTNESEILGYSWTGATSIYHHFQQIDHNLTFWWDAGLETWIFHAMNTMRYFWHDGNCTPIWEFELIVDVDPERSAGDYNVSQTFESLIEIYGLDYYTNGGPQFVDDYMTADVGFDYSPPVYTVYTEIDIAEPGQYMLIINSTEIFGKPTYIPIMAFNDTYAPDWMVQNIPNINEQENVVVIARSINLTDQPFPKPIILKNGSLSPTSNVITVDVGHPFLIPSLDWHIQINIFGQTGSIVIEKSVEYSTIKHFCIKFAYPYNYTMILPEKPIPAGGTVFYVNYPYNAVWIRPTIMDPWTDVTISVAQTLQARNVYIWMPESNHVTVELLKDYTLYTPPTLPSTHSLALYTNVSTDQADFEMDAGYPGMSHPFAWGTLYEPPNVDLSDTHTEDSYNLEMGEDSGAPYVNLLDSTEGQLHRVQLTPDWMTPDWTAWKELFPGDVNRDCKVRVDDVLAVALAFGADIGDPRYECRLDLNSDGKIRVDDILTVALEFGKDYTGCSVRKFPPQL